MATRLLRGATVSIAACLLAAGCRPAPITADQASAEPVRYVKWLTDDEGATGFYKTDVSLTDCAAQAAEMIALWNVVVRPTLEAARPRPRPRELTLFPEEPSGRSASFTFRRDRSGRWRADAPCVVTIPD